MAAEDVDAVARIAVRQRDVEFAVVRFRSKIERALTIGASGFDFCLDGKRVWVVLEAFQEEPKP